MTNTNQNNKNYYIELYFRRKNYLQKLENIDGVFKNINLKDFEKSVEEELDDFKKDIISKYHLQNVKLKNIANDMNFSYSYIRRIYLEGKDKMRIILSMMMKDLK